MPLVNVRRVYYLPPEAETAGLRMLNPNRSATLPGPALTFIDPSSGCLKSSNGRDMEVQRMGICHTIIISCHRSGL